MKTKRLSLLILLTLVSATANRALAATPQRATAEEKIKTQVSKALGNQKNVTVKLKSGVAIKGQVQEVSSGDFKLQKSDTGLVQTIAYADVAAVQEPNQL